VVSLLLFALASTATRSLHLPEYLPLLPGTAALVFLGIAYLYAPLHVVGFVVDLARVRNADIGWTPSGWFAVGGGTQAVYVTVPLVQAYGGTTFEEVVFGSVELTALLLTGLVTTRYLHARDTCLPQSPPLVSLCAAVWATIDRR
jgi:hypothetical protein